MFHKYVLVFIKANPLLLFFFKQFFCSRAHLELALPLLLFNSEAEVTDLGPRLFSNSSVSAISSPSGSTLPASRKFLYVVFSFRFNSEHLLFSYLTHGFFGNMLFHFQVLESSPLISDVVSLSSENIVYTTGSLAQQDCRKCHFLSSCLGWKEDKSSRDENSPNTGIITPTLHLLLDPGSVIHSLLTCHLSSAFKQTFKTNFSN